MFYTAEVFHLTLSIYSHSLFSTTINKEKVFFFECKQKWIGFLLYNKHIQKLSLKPKKSQLYYFYLDI